MRKRRLIAVLLALISMLAGAFYESRTEQAPEPGTPVTSQAIQDVKSAQTTLASTALEELEIKGRAPKTGYNRDKFSNDWGELYNCSLRELVLQRDLEQKVMNEDNCRVMSGVLNDPYTGTQISFTRGAVSSQAVQIDHVVAVSDAWQKGAQQLSSDLRYQFYNDPLNLLAVDGPTNNKKGDGDAATWLPPNKDYRCRYVARQIAVKIKYSLWVTQAEHDAISSLLNSCPDQEIQK